MPLPCRSTLVSNGDHLAELLSYASISLTITLADSFPGRKPSGERGSVVYSGVDGRHGCDMLRRPGWSKLKDFPG